MAKPQVGFSGSASTPSGMAFGEVHSGAFLPRPAPQIRARRRFCRKPSRRAPLPLAVEVGGRAADLVSLAFGIRQQANGRCSPGGSP